MIEAPIEIPSTIRAAIYAHAREAYPDECCGYLTGAHDAHNVDGAVVCDNAQGGGDNPAAPERSARDGFVIAGRQLFDFARSFSGPSPARVVYHSHPNGRAYLSAVDRAVAAPDGPAYPVQHLVIGITAEAVVEVAQFAWSDDAHDYVEVARWSVP
jgi:proteasome lid subunit RPN8/RPN11